MSIGLNIPEYEVSQFNRLFKDLIELNFDYVRIRGEISELKNAVSGHVYITLKDNNSVLNATIWNQKKQFLQIKPEVGMEVIVTGKISTYAKSISTYSINIDKLELAGEGALLKLIEDRKKRLKEQGIFNQKNKKQIPYLPNKIGVITSPTGSVIHDIINRIKDRFPVNIDIWPVLVQGVNSSKTIIDAINGFHHDTYYDKPDVIIIARGGGSIEDLMVFNDENLALTVYQSTIPIISAIGHETDTTIIDYVSDLRVSTPSAAAEKAVPVLQELIQDVNLMSQRINLNINNIFNENYLRFQNLSKYLKAPSFVIKSFNEKLNLVSDNLLGEFKNLFLNNYQKVDSCLKLLRLPKQDFKIKDQYLKNTIKNLDRNFINKIIYQKKELNKLIRLLESNSIKVTLNKGYSIIRKSNKIVKKSININSEDTINIQFEDKFVDMKIKKF